LSLIVHAAAAFLFSFVIVTQEVTRYVKREMAGSVDLNLNVPKDVEIGMSVRGQFTGLGSDEALAGVTAAAAALPASERVQADERPLAVAEVQLPSAQGQLARAMLARTVAIQALPTVAATRDGRQEFVAGIDQSIAAPGAAAAVDVAAPRNGPV